MQRHASARRWPIAVAATLLAAAAVLVVFNASRADATHVAPSFVAGNPKCVDLGYDFGFKPQPEPPPDGTYFFGGPVTTPPHALTAESVTITNGPGDTFAWTSTIGIDAVIVKGGPNINLYVYDPPLEAVADTGLHAPINPNNNEPYAVSHISFCYDWEVDVDKTADAEFTRTWTWEIDKTANTAGPLNLSPGQQFAVTYWVDVDATPQDSDWAVSGEIWVENNTPLVATVTSVTDVISGPIVPAVNCPPLPAVLAPGDSLHCTYNSPLPDGSDRVNTATVATSGDVGGGQATANVTFGAPTTEIDEEIDVDDDLFGPLGTVDASLVPASFHYQRNVGPFTDQQCGDQQVKNTATFTTNDTGAQGSDMWTVRVFVDCPPTGGCTLTQGYWKTHSDQGPAPFDDTWDLILPSGAATPFFASGESYYQVLWTAPQGGNAWYILAHQYTAAELNVLNGAAIPPAVLADWTAAGTLLQQFDADGPGTPGQNLIPRGPNRNTAIALAGTLAGYNEGTVGPGHCDE